MANFVARTILLAEDEATYKTAPASINNATNAMRIQNLNITPIQAERVERTFYQGGFGGRGGLVAGSQVNMTYGVELAGAGDSSNTDTAPAWAPLIQACGAVGAAYDDSTPTGPVPLQGNNAYRFTWRSALADQKSVTQRAWLDAFYQQTVGSRGTFSISMSRQNLPEFSFNFSGIYAGPMTGTRPTGVSLTGFVSPVAYTSTNTFVYGTIGSSSLATSPVSAVDFNLNNTITYRNNFNNQEDILITDRQPTLSITREVPATGYSSDSVKNATLGSDILIQQGTAAGNVVEIYCKSVQVTNITVSDQDGVWYETIEMSALATGSSDDDVVIQTR